MTERAAWLGRVCSIPLLVDRNGVVDGVPANSVENLGNPEGMISLIGRSLRELHDTPIDGDTATLLDDGWAWLDAEIAARLEAGAIVPDELPDPYRRYDAERLVALWAEGRPDPSEDDIVVCHGRPTLDRFVVHRGDLVGLVGTDSMCLGDRHLDLAIVHQSLQATIGGEAAFIFYDAYGIAPNVVRLDHYIFADLLVR